MINNNSYRYKLPVRQGKNSTWALTRCCVEKWTKYGVSADRSRKNEKYA